MINNYHYSWIDFFELIIFSVFFGSVAFVFALILSIREPIDYVAMVYFVTGVIGTIVNVLIYKIGVSRTTFGDNLNNEGVIKKYNPFMSHIGYIILGLGLIFYFANIIRNDSLEQGEDYLMNLVIICGMGLIGSTFIAADIMAKSTFRISAKESENQVAEYPI